VRLEISGEVLGTEGEIEVKVALRNAGDTAAANLTVEGEILGNTSSARLPAGIPAQGRGEVRLKFPGGAIRAGVHPLALLLDYDGAGRPAPSAVSQRAYLLLGLGGVAGPSVRLSMEDARMDDSGVVSVSLASLDASPHEARLRLLGPRGFRADPPADEVDVPAHGSARVPIRVFRGSLPWGSRQGLLALAEVGDGPLATTAVASGIVDVAPDPARMPALRRPLLAAGIALLGLAAWLEARRRLG